MEQKRRGGWPKRTPDPAERVVLSCRVTPELKAALDQVVADNGRSLAQEVESRLEVSFHDRRLLDEALELAYGQQTAAVLQVLAKIIEQAEVECSWVLALAGRNKELNADWIDHPYINNQAIDGMARALEALRAPGDPSPPSHDTDGQDITRMASRAGQRAAANVLDAAIDPELAVRGLGRWARRVSEALGEELVERIAEKERAPGRTRGDLIARAQDRIASKSEAGKGEEPA